MFLLLGLSRQNTEQIPIVSIFVELNVQVVFPEVAVQQGDVVFGRVCRHACPCGKDSAYR